MSLVSIIMPAFNAERFIGSAIDSVRRQSYTKWELLVTDDGSSDDTAKIVNEVSRVDSRVSFFSNECGKGAASARNNSIRYATGDFIAFLDADDLWNPEKLRKQLAFIDEVNADFSYTGYRHINVESVFMKQVEVPGVVDHKTLLTGNVIATATVLIRRSAFLDLTMPDFPRAQDFALWLKLLRQKDCAYGLNEPLSDYRVTPNTGKRRKIFALKYLYDIYTQQERKSGFQALVLIVKMYLYRSLKYKSVL